MNYASSSSGILNHTELLTRECLPLSKQIDLFERTVKLDPPWKISLENKLKLHLEKSIILISISGNDYILRHFIDKTMSAKLDLNSYATLLVQSFSASIERMVDLGAKKFVVLGMLPIGCSNFFPDQNQGKCSKTVSNIIESYNSQLTAALDNVRNNRAILYILINPAKLDVRKAKTEIGSKFMFKQCCEVDKFGGCIKSSKACENRDEHLLFDKNHMSQIYQKYIADGSFKGTGTCMPYDVVELCRK